MVALEHIRVMGVGHVIGLVFANGYYKRNEKMLLIHLMNR